MALGRGEYPKFSTPLGLFPSGCQPHLGYFPEGFSPLGLFPRGLLPEGNNPSGVDNFGYSPIQRAVTVLLYRTNS